MLNAWIFGDLQPYYSFSLLCSSVYLPLFQELCLQEWRILVKAIHSH